MSDVIVIGGGLHGCSAALHLARAGADVTIVEKDVMGAHASSLNAGGVRRLGRHPAEIPLSVAASKIWPDISALVDDDCGFHASAQIRVAETDEALRALQDRVALVNGLGWQHEQLIDRNSLRERLPEVGPQCIGAVMVEGDGYADPPRTSQAFARACRSAGVKAIERCAVENIVHDGKRWQVEAAGQTIEADWLINAAGAWSGQLAAMTGEPVPLRAAALMMAQTEPRPYFLDAVIGSQGRALSLKQTQDGSLLIGGGVEGTADLTTGTCTLDRAGLKGNLQTAIDIFPVLADVVIARTWAGIEGMLPDGLPVIDRSPNSPNAVHVFGFCGHGFQLAPVVGALVADLVEEREPSLPIDPFSISRFNVPTDSNSC